MAAFAYLVCVACVATVLGVSGIGHLVDTDHARRVVGEQRVVRIAPAMVVAGLVTFEIATAALCLVALFGDPQGRAGLLGLSAAVLGGAALHAYVRALRMRPDPPATCGCTPWDGPLSAASATPSRVLVVAGITGIALLVAGQALPVDAAVATTGPAMLLAPLWGSLAAVIALLLSATTPLVDVP